MKKVSFDLKEVLINDPLTFLVGAGCSINSPSSLPAGRAMMNVIIEHVSTRKDYKKLANLSELRFESLVEIVRDNVDPTLKTIDYYAECDKPNLIHFFLAKMIEKGNFVMTTNFDLLIEHAMINSGIPNEDIRIAITRKDFEILKNPKRLYEEGQKTLYKIHGSTKNLLTNESTKDSLIATIQAFGSNKQGLNVFQVEPFKRELFDNISKGRTLIVMGYSGSDDFDVVPTLKVLHELKSVIWIDHTNSADSKIYEVESSSTGNGKKVDQILIDIKNKANIPHVYKVEMNTLEFAKLIPSSGYSISNVNFNLTPQEWLQENVEVEEESIRFLIPQQIFHDYNLYDDSLRCARQLLEFAQKNGNSTLEVRARILEGKVLSSSGAHTEALKIFKNALSQAKSLESEEWTAAALNNIANVLNSQASYSESLNYFKQALQIFESQGSLNEQGIILRNISSILKNLNQNSDALDYSLKALRISEILGKLSDKGDLLMIIGMIEVSMGKIEDATKHFEESLMINDQLHDYDAKIGSLNVLGDLMMKLGDFNQSLIYLQNALTISKTIKDSSGEASTLNNLGMLYTKLSNFTEAMNFLNQAQQIAKNYGDPLTEANSFANIGIVYYYQGQMDTALKIWEKTVKIYERSGYEFGKASIYINMGDVYYQKQKYKKSLQVLEEALKIGRKSNDLAIQTNSLQKLGMILQDQKDFKGATEFYSQGLQICQELGDLVGIATLTNNLGTIEFYGKNYNSALEKYNEAYNNLNQIGLGIC
ncbi:hypothetical protein LCGC14_0519420 [marine sediment metagenome]|uniref:Uncharacterized protein n=1 Tax=marine sediment metagenome TaxID=412755 RepID=A0A0F9SH89_9ZZZZ